MPIWDAWFVVWRLASYAVYIDSLLQLHVRPLVQRLHQQVLRLAVPAEFRCVDDASEASFVAMNQSLQQLPQVHWEALPTNMGRSKIRNYLAQTAQYDFLLFMDSDSMPVQDDYLERYVAQLPT